MAYKTVIYEKKGKIACITLNRPEVLNAFNSQMCDEMQQIWHDFDNDENLWVAILTGAGERAFCSGADVKRMAEVTLAEMVRTEHVARRDPQGKHRNLRITAWQNDVTKPVITAVNGMCVGGGLHFIADTDICICSENATFFDTHVNRGLIFALEAIGLERRMPVSVLFEMALLGQKFRIDAQRAYQLGLVSRVVPLHELMPTATSMAEIICENAPMAVRISKESIWRGLDYGLHQAYDLGEYLHREDEGTYEPVEGTRAFKEKREPRWTGYYEPVE